MQRRTFLSWLSLGGALSALCNTSMITTAVAGIQSTLTGLRRVRPGDANWPADTAWSALNNQVDGNLIKVAPLFMPCVDQPDGAQCADLVGNLRNPFYLGDQPGGTQVSGWFKAWKPEPSAYAIKAHNTAHVVAGVNFARKNNLRLVVKGTGHSYQGTSNAPDSLLIWTRAMRQVTIHDQFVPHGGAGLTAPVPAVSAESGAVWIDLYHAVVAGAGRYVQGGGCTDVGVAGLIQSGGFGSFSKGFGMAAASLLEAEVVTADGVARVVNAYSDPELFWALKGGGGGSWGVVTRVTLRTYDLPEHFGSAWGKIKAGSDAAYHRLIDHFLRFYTEQLFNPHWGEQIHLGSDKILEISMVSQGLDTETSKKIWQPFFDWVRAAPSDYTVIDDLGTHAGHARGWWDMEGNDAMIQDKRVGAPAYHGWWKGDQAQVGAYLHGYDSIWMPAHLLDPAHRPQLVNALIESSRFKTVHIQFNKGLAGARPDALQAASDTATNPAACSAFALIIIADGERPAYAGQPAAHVDVEAAQQDAHQIDLAMLPLTRIVPNPGSYVSESNYFNPRWQQAFWGPHYGRLQAVKKRYDPDGLFFVHHGVGSEEWSADGFVQVSKS